MRSACKRPNRRSDRGERSTLVFGQVEETGKSTGTTTGMDTGKDTNTSTLPL